MVVQIKAVVRKMLFRKMLFRKMVLQIRSSKNYGFKNGSQKEAKIAIS